MLNWILGNLSIITLCSWFVLPAQIELFVWREKKNKREEPTRWRILYFVEVPLFFFMYFILLNAYSVPPQIKNPISPPVYHINLTIEPPKVTK